MTARVEGVATQRARRPARFHQAGGPDGERGHLLSGGEEAGGRPSAEEELHIFIVAFVLVLVLAELGRDQHDAIGVGVVGPAEAADRPRRLDEHLGLELVVLRQVPQGRQVLERLGDPRAEGGDLAGLAPS